MEININIWIVLIILFVHWVADFVFQTDWQATNKSKNNKALLSHTGTYTLVWIVLFNAFVIIDRVGYSHCAADWGLDWTIILFFPITFVCHTITDYFTSRINSKLWAEKKVHYFFVSIGFDQLLHFAQLLLTYQILTNGN